MVKFEFEIGEKDALFSQTQAAKRKGCGLLALTAMTQYHS
jgi:hypothetical protein